MMRWQLTVLLLSLGTALGAGAETVSCPALSTAAQVAACPAEEELKVTFVGYCSDDARSYELTDKDTCVSYENYRRRKNVALWEAAGEFQAYLSCDLPAEAVRELKPSSIVVMTQGTLTRVVCSYPRAVTFAYRTKAQCKVEGSGNCSSDPASCKASCQP